MPDTGTESTVEERLEKARLLSRISPEVLSMCKSVDQLLHAQHMSNLAQAIVCVQELARDHTAVVIALKWVVLLVDMLESDSGDVRLAACNAVAAVCMAQEGRDAVRSAGGLRPLVMLLAEGSRSAVAAAAAAALMNCSACDVCKEAISDCRGVPMLLGLIREAVGRVNPALREAAAAHSHGRSPASFAARNATAAGAASTINAMAAAAAVAATAAAAGGGSVGDLRTPADCKAAAFAAGALMNMGGIISVQERLTEAGAVAVFEGVLRSAGPGDVVATRSNFMLSWLAVASGAAVGAAGSGTGVAYADSPSSTLAEKHRPGQGPGHLQQPQPDHPQRSNSITCASQEGGPASEVSTPRSSLQHVPSASTAANPIPASSLQLSSRAATPQQPTTTGATHQPQPRLSSREGAPAAAGGVGGARVSSRGPAVVTGHA